jgi:hypothetical protein
MRKHNWVCRCRLGRGDKQYCKSYTGFVFKLEGAVSWESRRQCTIALSSTEAENMAVAEATEKTMYRKGFLGEILGEQRSIVLYSDNQGTQKLACNPVFHNRTNYIDIRHHFFVKL